MHRTATFVLFLCGLPTVFASPYFDLDHQFSKTVKPCQDFYKYVCNPGANGNESFAYQLQNKFSNKIISSALNYSDPLIDFLRQIYLRDMKNETQFKEGLTFGKASASGYKRFVITANVRKETFEIVDEQSVGRGKVFNSVECVYKNCPVFVKGIVSGYKQLVDDDNLIDLKKWKIIAKYVEVKAPEVTEEQRAKANTKFFKTRLWAPYLNVLTAKFATENSLWIPRETAEELKRFGSDLVDDAVAQIQNQSWIPEDRKLKAIENLKSIEKVLVLSEATKDLRIVEKAISFYVSQFQKKNGNILAQMKNESCNLECVSELTAKLIHQIMHSYNLKYGHTDEFVDLFTYRNSQSNLNVFNAFTILDRMLIHPALQLYMNEALPVGFRWSTIGIVVAHELYHSLDPRDSYLLAERASKHLRGLPEYDEAAKCYKDYYGSFGARAPNGTIFYPDSSLKVGEGFADVEGMRAALRVLKKTLFTNRAFKSSYSYSTYNDIEWFFQGVMMMSCEAEEQDDYELYKSKYYVNPHPRGTVRLNALVRQLDEFKDLYQCKPGDQMYVVEKQCKTFL